MPFSYVPAEVFLTHADRQVFHVYRNDDVGQGVRQYWYSVVEESSETDLANSFDVRDLPQWSPPTSAAGELAHIRAVIVAAIDAGSLP